MKKSSNKILIIVIVVLLLAIAGGVSYLYLGGYFHKKIEIPDFSSMTKEEMQIWIGENKLEGEQYEIKNVYDERTEDGNFVSQSLPAGAILGEEELVISYSIGKDPNSQFELPVTWKLTKENLQKWFDMKGFSDVTYEYVIDPDHSAGDVLKMNKSGYAKRSDPILVTVAADINDDSLVVSVPDFSGYTRTQINAWAEANMITIRYAYDLSDTVEQGKVLRQSVKAGEEVHPLSEITITISDGKGVILENLVGMTRAQAAAWASENNLKFSYTQEYSDKVESGIVISMSPKQGVTVSENSTVTVVVSKGPRPSATLSGEYIGKPVTDFLAYIRGLENITLKTNKTGSSYSDYPKDSVLSYDSSRTYYEDETVNYTTSLGPYEPNAGEFNGLSSSQVYDKVSSYNSLGAGIVYNNPIDEINDSVPEGTSFGCSFEGKTLTCKIAKPTIITMADLRGMSIDGAKNWITSNELTVGEITGEYSSSTANTIIRQSYEPGVQLRKGTVINLTYSMGIHTASFPNINVLRALCNTSNSADATESTLRGNSSLAEFSNITFVRTSSDDTPGYIISVTADGVNIANGGDIDVNANIVILICESYLEN